MHPIPLLEDPIYKPAFYYFYLKRYGYRLNNRLPVLLQSVYWEVPYSVKLKSVEQRNAISNGTEALV
jgi:hypothetical protein